MKQILDCNKEFFSHRLVMWDTETTGLYASSGDRMIQFGAVVVENGQITKEKYNIFINPQRSVGESYSVHLISDEQLQDKPLFEEEADRIMSVFKNSIAIAHNAPFDIRFIETEMAMAGKPIDFNQEVIKSYDSAYMSKSFRTKGYHTLDALAKSLNVDISRREERHDALLDCEILAECIIEMGKVYDFTKLKDFDKIMTPVEFHPFQGANLKNYVPPVIQNDVVTQKDKVKIKI